MFCMNCGKNLDNDAKFCPYCGAVITAGAPRPGPAPEPASVSYGNTGTPDFDQEPQRPKGQGLKKILACAAAVVLVAALAAGLYFSGAFSGDKGKLGRAVAKSISAYTGAARDAGLPDLRELIEGQKLSQSGEVVLEDIDLGWYGYFLDYSVSALEGTGVRFSTNYDLPGEKLSASVTPFYGSADLLTAELVMDGSKIYVNSPQLLGNTYYGLDTATLGKDLQGLGAGEDQVGNISFNIFQLMKDIQKIAEMDDESRKAIEDASKELLDAIEVEKGETETVKVNGGSVECDAYTVMIPRSAMKDYLREVRRTVSDSVDYTKDLIELFSSLGLPDEAVKEIKRGLSNADTKQSVKTMFNGLEDVVDVLGDVELQVYVGNGYVMAVTYSNRIEGARVKAELYLGGGKNYVDDLSLTVSGGDSYSKVEIALTSHGDHSAKGGAFKDETVLEITQYGYTTEFSSEMSYAAKKDRNNFSWRIDFEDGRIDMEGQMTTGKNSMELHLTEVEFRADDVSVTFRVDYSIGAYQSIPSVKSPVMLSTLTEKKLQDIADDVRDNVTDWVRDLLDEIPELGSLVGMGGMAYPYF